MRNSHIKDYTWFSGQVLAVEGQIEITVLNLCGASITLYKIKIELNERLYFPEIL